MEQCPRCKRSDSWGAVEKVCFVCGYGNMKAADKDVERARMALAETLCNSHFTDGFCRPRDNADCKCVKLANACMSGMATVGVKPVWVFNKDKS